VQKIPNIAARPQFLGFEDKMSIKTTPKNMTTFDAKTASKKAQLMVEKSSLNNDMNNITGRENFPTKILRPFACSVVMILAYPAMV
jgi:hypothetical protein